MRNGILSLLLLLALGAFVFVFATGKGAKSNPSQPAAVEGVSPEGGDLDLRQATIMADLAPGYTGYLEIDGIEVPDDDLQRVPALNTITLKPTVDSAYQQLEPGRHCAAVVYRQTGTPIENSSTYHWCFSLH